LDLNSLVQYSFDETSISLEFNGGDTWTWGGTGVFYTSGSQTPNAGHWHISSSTDDNGATFSFQSSNGTNVPDTGTTALLASLGLLSIGLYALRAKLVKA